MIKCQLLQNGALTSHNSYQDIGAKGSMSKSMRKVGKVPWAIFLLVYNGEKSLSLIKSQILLLQKILLTCRKIAVIMQC